jgi:type IV pilus assembly protein PilW
MRIDKGFSLIELLVSLLIGLLLSVALASMAINYGASRQASISANTADINGSMAAQILTSSLQQAGNGLVSGQNQTCTTLYSSTLSGVSFSPLAIDVTGANSNRLSFSYGTGSGTASMLAAANGVSDVKVGTPVVVPANAYNSVANGNTTRNDADILTGDNILYAYGLTLGACTLLTVANTSVASGNETITTATNSILNPPSYNTTFYVVPIKNLVYKTFFAENGMLKAKDNLTNTVSIIADGVVYLRAQYGEQVGTDSLLWTDQSPASLSALKAVRVSLVIRTSSTEKQSNSANCTSTTNSIVAFSNWTDSSDGTTAVDVSTLQNTAGDALIPDWKCYFYKSYTVVVPLRSLIWGPST